MRANVVCLCVLLGCQGSRAPVETHVVATPDERVPVLPIGDHVGLVALATTEGLRTVVVSAQGLHPAGWGALVPRDDGLWWLDVARVEGEGWSADELVSWRHGTPRPPARDGAPAPGMEGLESVTLQVRFVGPERVTTLLSGTAREAAPHMLSWTRLRTYPWPGSSPKAHLPTPIDSMFGESAREWLPNQPVDRSCLVVTPESWGLAWVDHGWMLQRRVESIGPPCQGLGSTFSVSDADVDAHLTGWSPNSSSDSSSPGEREAEVRDVVEGPGGLLLWVYPDRVTLVVGSEVRASLPWVSERVVAAHFRSDEDSVRSWVQLGQP